MLLALLLLQEDDLASLKTLWASQRNDPLLNRVETIHRIAALKTDDAADFLITDIYLASHSHEVNEAIAAALATNASDRALGGLKMIVVRDREQRAVRQAALDSIFTWKTDEAREVVAQIARNRKPNNDLRESAIGYLARYPIEQTRADWLRLLDENEAVARVPALRALAPLKEERIVEKAVEIFEDPKQSEEIRGAAVAPLAAVGDEAQARRLLQATFEEGGPLERALLVGLATLTDPAAARLVRAFAVDSARPSVRILCVRALAAIEDADAVATLEKALRDPLETVAEHAVESLARRGAWAPLRVKAAAGAGRAELAAVAALAADPGAAELLLKLADDANDSIRVKAVLALSNAGALPLLWRHLDHPHWSTRAAAIRSLARIRDRASIERLMERLEKEDGRLRWDIAVALAALTGKMLGYTAEPWREWWDRNAETFEFPASAEVPAAVEATTKAYYGVPLLSKRVIFCIDASGSMDASSGDRPLTKLEAARRELKETLKSLDEDVRFNVVFFSDTARSWKPSLRPATADHVAGAVEDAKRVKAEGGTNIWGTLASTLADEEADTIFLLSDGEASQGRLTDPEHILREFGFLNGTRLVVVHTIALGPNSFMKELAARTGGKYVEK